MPVVVDFETLPIIGGSGRYPRPVGVSIQHLGKEPCYFSFGHPGDGNSCQEYFAKAALARVWDSPDIIFHNCKFDVGVAMEHWGFDWPKHYHDTQFLLYLDDPIAKSLSLKPSAERILGMKPEEQDRLKDWILANRDMLRREHPKIVTESIKESNWGAYIGLAPASIVGPYCNGDVIRTGLLWEELYPKIQRGNMEEAYRRELDLVPTLYEMERCGVRVDRLKLINDRAKYHALYVSSGETIRRLLGDIDVDKPGELAYAIEHSPLGGTLKRTPTGKLSTAKESLIEAVTDPELLTALRYRSTLKTLIFTFFDGWIKFSEKDSYVHPSWNQTRGSTGLGTRTGRISCNDPNLTNVPTEFGEKESDPLYGLELPFMRQYLLPDPGKVIVAADYNGQEMRGLAHFAEGKALEIYRDDPRADFHVVASRLVYEASGIILNRKQAKITGFSLIYGAGVPALAAQLGVDKATASGIKSAYLDAIPGLRDFQDSFNYRSSVRTKGGRTIPVEPAIMYNGALWSFNYKLCNYLIQGSASDQTKDALIKYDQEREYGDVLIQVYDEIVIQVDEDKVASEVPILRDAMENQEGWDVPFIAEVEVGPNWHNLSKYEPT